MSVARKNVYNQTFFMNFIEKMIQVYPVFPQEEFLSYIYQDDWEGLELKQRIRRVTESLGKALPASYPEAIQLLRKLAPQCVGFPYLFFPDYVERYGQKNWELSMQALEEFTASSTAEFAVRPFIQQNPDKMMAQMLAWTQHSSEHVRRLASEGCRPKLPWATPLTIFRQDPSAILPILEQLNEDPSKYVQKSVANNLNDISKDHPDIVREIIQKWQLQHPITDWILRHGSRTLLKQADPIVLQMFGYLDAEAIMVTDLSLSSDQLILGDTLTFSFQVINPTGSDQKLRIEYAVDFVKANGRQNRKIFQLSDRNFADGATEVVRKQQFINLSTRKHYPGRHQLTILVNGQEKASQSFELMV
ncbi:DNA alkylation repair protein [Gracilibacillus alcaliphilus]|uniref:DNA alkylation repair protein n=1 Tax=Gracilibacillus alcaliphilus TaxID=1401441 RepID=UPI00195902DB|nr:DNA alkylation repair protein [Gracilibacillus alcaliphilus]MBM7679781.1 3-methyladenine DNA glycosylase AlkC [Gracilibacillus alcaliphilus]